MGPVLKVVDNNWLMAVGNLGKERKSWAQLAKILRREDSNPRGSGMFFKAVVQAVLLFRLETWVLTPHMERPCDASNTGFTADNGGTAK